MTTGFALWMGQISWEYQVTETKPTKRKKIRYSDSDTNYGHCTRKYGYLKGGAQQLTIVHGCDGIQRLRNKLLMTEHANPNLIAHLQEILDGCPISCCYKSTDKVWLNTGISWPPFVFVSYVTRRFSVLRPIRNIVRLPVLSKRTKRLRSTAIVRWLHKKLELQKNLKSALNAKKSSCHEPNQTRSSVARLVTRLTSVLHGVEPDKH